MNLDHSKTRPANAAKTSAVETRPAESSRSKRELLICIMLFAVTALAFVPALGNDFVQWDDDISVYRNPHILGLDLERLGWMFTNVSYALRYKPLTWLAYALIYAVNGMNPFGFHLVGLLFHAVNTVLVYLMIRRLLDVGLGVAGSNPENVRRSMGTALGTLIWALNPLRVEPVARVTDMTYGMSLCFTLVSLLCYLRALQPQINSTDSRRWYWLSVTAFVVAMLSYPFVCGYALVLVVLDLYPLRRFAGGFEWKNPATRRVFLEKVPFFMVAGISVVSFIGIEHPTGIWSGQNADASLSLTGRVMQAFYVWAYYAWKPWIPLHLSPVYTTLVTFDPLGWKFLFSAAMVVAITVLLFLKRCEWPLGLALWCCHLILLVPALGFTQHPHYANDRYCYMAGVLWAGLIAAMFVKWCSTTKIAASSSAALLSLAAGLGLMSYQQTQVWQDSPTLFRHAIAELGNDPYRTDIYRRLGEFYLLHGKAAEAVPELKEALRIYPGSAQAHTLLGLALLELEQPEGSISEFQEALRLQPRYAVAHNGYGAALCRKQEYEAAIREFRAALAINPDYTAAKENLRMTLEKAGKN